MSTRVSRRKRSRRERHSRVCALPGSWTVGRLASDARAATGTHPPTLVDIPGGSFVMGDESEWAYPGDGEGPAHDVEVSGFAIDRFAVTNDGIRRVRRTPPGTSPTRSATAGRSCSRRFLPDGFPDTRAVVGAEWWRQVYGADWRHPDGPQSTIEDRMDHPVVHVSWTDASAYCAGPARACRPKPSGSTRRGPVPRGPFPVGRRTRARRRTPHERLPRTLSRTTIAAPTDTRGPRRSTRSPRTRSASTTSRATCGSGAKTGTTRATTNKARA